MHEIYILFMYRKANSLSYLLNFDSSALSEILEKIFIIKIAINSLVYEG